MGIMDLIRKISQNKAETKKKFKQMQEDDRLQNMLEERKKSSNRRELERYEKEQEEKAIKEALDKIHHKQQEDTWSGRNSIMNSKTTILKEDRPILMEKNIFLDNKTKIPMSGNHMFFKW